MGDDDNGEVRCREMTEQFVGPCQLPGRNTECPEMMRVFSVSPGRECAERAHAAGCCSTKWPQGYRGAAAIRDS
ncbi:hypothetical protein CYMTET_49698 [Cymbomonas tetramitiformis]|uniref:Uncharacterized protein n=1 Tax=Cymbomonas tetramitiformis TaxID=36881 RepID=A0AAE0BRB2_9CHLO|nr:hypothetical protein CYMTET_49698 [Cymbomonas tetramitiformis]